MDGITCLAVVSSPKFCLPTSQKNMMQPKIMSSTRCLSGYYNRVRAHSSCRNILGVCFAGEKARKHSFTVEPSYISRNHSFSKSIRISATVTPIRPLKITRQNDGGDSRPSTRSISQVRHFWNFWNLYDFSVSLRYMSTLPLGASATRIVLAICIV
jgi:hypothetical protein